VQQEIESAEERELRRTREPELRWKTGKTTNDRDGWFGVSSKAQDVLLPIWFGWFYTIEKQATGYFNVISWVIRRTIHHEHPKLINVLEECKNVDQAKLAAHEHWRDNGYE